MTGKAPSYAVQGIKPFVVLKTSVNKPFSRERAFLKQANMNSNVITAKTRMQISRIRDIDFSGNRSGFNGQKVTTLNNFSRGSNKNISSLNKIYRERLSQIKG